MAGYADQWRADGGYQRVLWPQPTATYSMPPSMIATSSPHRITPAAPPRVTRTRPSARNAIIPESSKKSKQQPTKDNILQKLLKKVRSKPSAQRKADLEFLETTSKIWRRSWKTRQLERHRRQPSATTTVQEIIVQRLFEVLNGGHVMDLDAANYAITEVTHSKGGRWDRCCTIAWSSAQAKMTLEEVGWYRAGGWGKAKPVKLVVHKI